MENLNILLVAALLTSSTVVVEIPKGWARTMIMPTRNSNMPPMFNGLPE